MSEQPLSPKPLPEDKKSFIRKVLTISGVIFCALGIASIASPALIMDFMGSEDKVLSFIFGAGLLIVGISDIAIARILFKQTINTLNNKETEL